MNNIENIIPVGKENAIHLEELAKRLNVKTGKAKSLVRKSREEGIQILSDANGYWISENPFEKIKFVAAMRKAALSRLKSATPINDTLKDVDGQISINDVINDMENPQA